MAETRLRLAATDKEDLTVISACLQDAITRGSAMTFLPNVHRFAAVLNRFMWEDQQDRSVRPPRRIRTGLHFDSVLSVRSKGIDRSGEAVLQLLAIETEEGEGGNATICLRFAGGGTVLLDVECVDGYLADKGAPWRARRKPAHDWKD